MRTTARALRATTHAINTIDCAIDDWFCALQLKELESKIKAQESYVLNIEIMPVHVLHRHYYFHLVWKSQRGMPNTN